MDLRRFVNDVIREKHEIITDSSDKIFDYAELGFHEFKTVELYEKILCNEGFQVEMGIAGMPTAFKASYGCGKPVIGFLAEYDALPELAQKGGCIVKKAVEGSSTSGHGCGHNLLGAGAMAAAIVVKEYLSKTNGTGTVILFGCPSEEKGNGKTIMARDGVFTGVDAAFTWHPGDHNRIWSESTLANVSVFFTFKGVTSHAAAAPELGRSALDAAELMSVGVNYLREHIISEARVHYAYRDVGGSAPNVVQGHAQVHYFIRAPKLWQVREIYKRVVDVAEGAAKMTGTEMSYELYAGLSEYLPNHILSEILFSAMKEIGAPEYDENDYALASRFFHEGTDEELLINRERLKAMFGVKRAEEIENCPLHSSIEPLIWNEKVTPGSTDVGDASQVMPTAMCTMATATLGTAIHTWQMTAHGNTEIAHKAMLNAGKAMALAALKIIQKPELLQQIHNEWLEATNGKYECPIPEEIGPRLED